MSHDRRDAVGGHVGTGIVYDDGFYSASMEGRRFAKKFNRREARREARKITAAALVELEEEYQEAMRVEFDWSEYDDIFNDPEFDDPEPDVPEYDEFDYPEYYDYYAYDY